jgi:uncharacterized membrane protein
MSDRVDPMVARLAWLGTALALVGIAVSGYLTVEHYSTTTTLSCPDTGIVNCVKVTTSSYATVAGVPVAAGGLAFFVAMAVLQLPVCWRRGGRAVSVLRAALAAAGVAAVLWLVYVELFRLDAVCLWCTAVHVVAVALGAQTAFATALAGGPEPLEAGT